MAFGSLLFRSRLLATAMPPLARLVFLDWPHSNSAAAQRRIPACVGRPIRSRGSCGSSPAHPLRVPGCKCPSTLGHTDRVSTLASSPRARGKPWVAFRCSRRPRRVHPRACGEPSIPLFSAPGISGPTPRVRGTRGRGGRSAPPTPVNPRTSGAHPVRASPELIGLASWSTGLSPATAGQSRRTAASSQESRVHRRCCGGGVSLESSLAVIVAGSSPPRRGCRSVDQLLAVELRCSHRVRGGRRAASRALSGVHRFRAATGGSSPGLPAAPGCIGGPSLVSGGPSSVSPFASR